MVKKPVLIQFDGAIGAGKTTGINAMVKQLETVFEPNEVVIILENVSLWTEKHTILDGEPKSLLELQYSDPKRWAFTAQVVIFKDGINAMVKTIRNNPNAKVFLMERGPSSNKLFMELLYEEGKMSEYEYTQNKEWAAMWEELSPFNPDLHVVFYPNLDICMDRITSRSRAGEELIPKPYQKALIAKHQQMFIEKTLGVPVLEITSNDFLHDIPAQVELTTYIQQLYFRE